MKKRLFRLVALALLLAFVGTGVTGCGGREVEEAIFYIKDGGLYYTDTEKIAPKLITADCYKGQYPGNSCYEVSNLICQDNKNGLFYPVDLKERQDSFYGTWTLRYQKLDKTEDTAIEIDTNIVAQTISANGELVTYIKDGTLYQSDCAGNVEKIHEQVQKGKVDYGSTVQISNDGKLLCYLDAQDTLFFKQSGQPEEALGKQVSQFFLSEDSQTVYFMAGKTLCKKTVGQAVEKLADGVAEILKVYASGEVYYMCKDEYEVYLHDYIDYDLQENTTDLVELLSPMTTSRTDYKLYYYDGIKSQKFAETTAMIGATIYSESQPNSDAGAIFYFGSGEKSEYGEAVYHETFFADDAPMMVYEATHPERMKKVKLSEIQDKLRAGIGEDYVSGKIGEALVATYDANIAVGATSTVFDEVTVKDKYDVLSKMYPASDGTSLFYIKEQFEGSWREDGKDDLYQCQIIDGVPQEAVFVDEIANVGTWLCDSVILLQDGTFAYYKNYDDEKQIGDLYIGQTFIDSNVAIWGWTDEGRCEGRVYYAANWDENRDCGTLKFYFNGETTTVAEDVFHYSDFADGSVLCFQNYNEASQLGDLYFYRDGTTTLMDEVTSGIVWNRENPKHGINYNY